MASGAWFILGFLWTVEALSSLQVSVTGDGTTSTESHRLGSYLWSQNSTNANCSWDNREPMMRSSDFQTLCRSTGNSQSSFVCAAMWDEFGARHAKSGDVVCVGRKLQFILSSSSLRLMADCTWTLDPDGLQIKRIDDSEVPMPIILSPDPPEASVDEEHMGTVLAHAFHDGASPFNIIMDALMAFLHLVSLDADITKTRVLAIPNRKNAASTYRLAHELFKTVFSRAEPMILPGDTEQHFFAEQLVVPSTAQLPLRRDRPGLVDVWPHCRYWPALQGFASFLKDGFHVRPIPDSQFSPHALILVDKPINLADQTDTPFPRDLKASLKAKAGIRSTVLNTMEMSAAELVRMFSMANIIVSEIAPTMELVILTMPCAEILEICRNGFDEFTEYFIQADRTKRCVNAKSDEDVDPVAIDLETAILEAQIRFDKCVGNRFKFARELQHEATAAKATREAQARAKEIAEQQATQSRQAVESLQAEADMINQLAGQAGGPLAEALRKTLGAASGRQAPCPKIITTKTATTQAPGEGGCYDAVVLEAPKCDGSRMYACGFFVATPESESASPATAATGDNRQVEATRSWSVVPDWFLPFIRRMFGQYVDGEIVRFTEAAARKGKIAPNPVYEFAASKTVAGRVVAIGDAVHLATPWTAAGAHTALMDAVSLGDVFAAESHGRRGRDMDRALSAYDKGAVKRAKSLLLQSRACSRRLLPRAGKRAVPSPATLV